MHILEEAKWFLEDQLFKDQSKEEVVDAFSRVSKVAKLIDVKKSEMEVMPFKNQIRKWFEWKLEDIINN